jgi:uncharacterized protein
MYRCRPGVVLTPLSYVSGPGRARTSAHPIELNAFDREYVTMSDRLFRLMERHQKLDRLIAAAQRRRSRDPLELLRLKKLKLAIKDRIAMLMRRHARG